MSLMAKDRFLRFCSAKAQSLVILSAEGEERLATPYQWRISFYSALSLEETKALLGTELACQIGKGNQSRYLHGVLTDLAMVTDDEAACLYSATLQPHLALLQHGCNLAVFQHISVPDLVCQILRRNNIKNIELRLQASYQPREYCIQYRESDFAFISRLLESEGIYYFFSHTASQHTLILVDHPSGHHAAAIAALPWHQLAGSENNGGILSWKGAMSLTAACVQYKSFNVEQAKAVEGECQGNKNGFDGVSFIDAHGLSKRDELQAAARLKMEQLEAQTQHSEVQLQAWWLSCGEKISPVGHPSVKGEFNISSLWLSVSNNLENQTHRLHCHATVFDSSLTWRPPCQTPVPQIAGVLTATVVGPAAEEIHTDKYGRIKIQFPWDADNNYDDSSSCWVRVSQPWSGSGFGALFIPRIGSEVLIGFIHGNPDYPVVTGTVYNGKNQPPLALPQEKNQAGFISRSSLDGNAEEGHQLRFDDNKGEEKLLIVSQKDLLLKIKNDLIAEIANEVKNTIGAGRTTEISKGDESLTLCQGNHQLTLEQGNLSTEIKQGKMVLKLDKGDYSLEVKGNQKESLSGGNHSLNVSGGGSTVKADKSCVIESTQSIELKVGSNKISITPAGITLSGTVLKIEGKGTAELGGAMVTVKGSGMTQVKGGVVMIG